MSADESREALSTRAASDLNSHSSSRSLDQSLISFLTTVIWFTSLSPFRDRCSRSRLSTTSDSWWHRFDLSQSDDGSRSVISALTLSRSIEWIGAKSNFHLRLLIYCRASSTNTATSPIGIMNYLNFPLARRTAEILMSEASRSAFVVRLGTYNTPNHKYWY